MLDIQYPLLMDGGLSNELERLGLKLDDKLWTSHLLDTHPDQIIQVHLSFLRAGAKCITTAGYQASIPALMDYGYTKSKALELISKSVEVAVEARQIFKNEGKNTDNVIIAASVGSYGAYLADGSEYIGKYGVSSLELKKFHKENIHHLSKSGADVLAFETMPSLTEVKAICQVLREVQTPAWVSFTIKDQDHISDGTLIRECAAYLADQPSVFAIGANCFSPKHVLAVIRNIKPYCGDKKIIVYPNKGLIYKADEKGWIEEKDTTTSKMNLESWVNEGADIIGGCCGVSCTDIQDYSNSINYSRSL